MNFEVSRRFQTQAAMQEITNFLEDSFRKSAGTVSNNGRSLIVESINATFGSINRNDRTAVEVKEKDGDVIVIASVEYKPSTLFWVFLVLGLFTTVAWLIPIAFYFFQKNTVKNGIEEVLNRAETEFRGKKSSPSEAQKGSGINTEDAVAQVERLAALKEKGILSDEEFAAQKAKVLGA